MQVLRPTYRTDEIIEALRPVLDSGWTGTGPKCAEMERAWSDYTGLPHSLFVSSCTAALHLALHVLRDGRRTEVVTSPLTFVSTNHAIRYAGLTPVFADVDESLCLNPQSVDDAIGPNTLAVVFVGIGGNPGRYMDIVRLCRERGVYLVLDGAHMAGTRVETMVDGNHTEWAHVGREADAACFSFQSVKNLPTADSGMLCLRHEALHMRARDLSWMGIDRSTFARSSGAYKWGYDVPEMGWKYNGNDIMATMALVGLRYLDADNARRRELAALYDAHLDGVERITHPPNTSRHLYQVFVPNREHTIARLTEAGYGCGVHYRANTEYPMYKWSRGATPIADAMSRHILSLPLHLGVTEAAIAEIATLL